VPCLRDGARIHLSSEKVLTKRRVGGRENDVRGRELLGSRSLGLLERADRLCEGADRIVVESHAVGIGGENRIGKGFRARLMEPVAGEPERIASVDLVEALGVTPLVVVDPVQLRTIQLLLYQRFDLGGRNALHRRELFRRPRLGVLSLAGCLLYTSDAADE